METAIEAHIDALRRGDYKNIRELLFNHLRHLIITGRLETGQKLIEEDLAEQFKVSRTPVREAIRKLEIEGLVRYQSRRGVIVTGFSRQDIDEIYATREVLEGLAARLAAQHATDEELSELGRLLEQINEASQANNFERAAQIHTQFDELLYRMGRNRRLVGILTQYAEYIEHGKMISLTRHGRADEIRAEHAAMFEAIAGRDPDAAEQAARLHVANARRAFFGQARVARSQPAPPPGSNGSRRRKNETVTQPPSRKRGRETPTRA
ncbi:MAG TPA: GntR family transcriptional regulator [bacterium]|nr:GntR family transcriptional regulator [bacterium]